MQDSEYYSTFAKKIIVRTGNRHLLKDDYAISFVASYIMKADNKWKPNMGTKRSSYLILHARYGVLNYVNFEKIKSISLSKQDSNDKKNNLQIEIEDKNECVTENVINNEIFEFIETLKPKQKLFIKEYYLNNKTLDAIGKENGITYEAVRLQIKHGLETIREKFNINV